MQYSTNSNSALALAFNSEPTPIGSFRLAKTHLRAKRIELRATLNSLEIDRLDCKSLELEIRIIQETDTADPIVGLKKRN